MSYPPEDKHEIIRMVEDSHLPVSQILGRESPTNPAPLPPPCTRTAYVSCAAGGCGVVPGVVVQRHWGLQRR